MRRQEQKLASVYGRVTRLSKVCLNEFQLLFGECSEGLQSALHVDAFV